MFKKNTATLTIATLLGLHTAFATPLSANQENKTESAPAKQIDLLKISEAFGHFIGKNLKTPGVNFDLESVIKGIRNGAEGKPAPMSDKEYEQMMSAIQERAFQAVSEENLKAANAFLVKNKEVSGVVELENGKLQYKIEKQGSGEVVGPHASPQINYSGQLIDGTVFNSSSESGGAITIPLDHTIKGFSSGIAGMKEGEKRRLFIHPDLGYGTTGHFPPNSLLIFDIEVVKANAPEEAANDSDMGDDADDEDDDDLEDLP